MNISAEKLFNLSIAYENILGCKRLNEGLISKYEQIKIDSPEAFNPKLYDHAQKLSRIFDRKIQEHYSTHLAFEWTEASINGYAELSGALVNAWFSKHKDSIKELDIEIPEHVLTNLEKHTPYSEFLPQRSGSSDNDSSENGEYWIENNMSRSATSISNNNSVSKQLKKPSIGDSITKIADSFVKFCDKWIPDPSDD